MALSLESSSGYSNSARELLRFGKREGKKACSSGDSYLRTMLWSASCVISIVDCLFVCLFVCVERMDGLRFHILLFDPCM